MEGEGALQDGSSIFEQLFESIVASNEVEPVVFGFRDAYGLSHATLHLAQTVSESAGMPYLRTTYPPEWVSRYIVKGYVKVDPVVKLGFQRALPFDWAELEATEEAQELMTESTKYGLGVSGYSIPVIDKSGRRSLFSVNSNHSAEEWMAFTDRHKQDWAELAHLLHKKAIFELYGERDPAPQLGPRELECLRWAAQGKDYRDIAMILQISDHTARGYLKSARHKLDCANLSQAVAKAIKLGMI